MVWVTALVLGGIALLVLIVIAVGRGTGTAGRDGHAAHPGDGGLSDDVEAGDGGGGE